MSGPNGYRRLQEELHKLVERIIKEYTSEAEETWSRLVEEFSRKVRNIRERITT
ncbi:hypothetical protein PABY_12220 [Pyrodictium abyssi]|uniref:Uncharacterized protein n=1 Tax=Pyrodictium abyssi TaxID=54256 RepID=A0ABM8IZJ2_9CREN|nr:hypothetical protein PABY_12220 [Pyrodictium abyssi]